MKETTPEATLREPVRQCAGCGKRFPKRTLLRICARDGKAVPDIPQKIQARGIYLCFNPACAAKALKSGRISSKLGISISPETAEEILAAAGNQDKND